VVKKKHSRTHSWLLKVRPYPGEDNMLTSQSFFDLADFPNNDLFTPADQVWQPLNDLKTYMDAYRYPKYDNVYIRNGVPLTEPIVIHRGRTLCFNELEIIYGNTTKGELQVNEQVYIWKGLR
jgi:hypothetical protein